VAGRGGVARLGFFLDFAESGRFGFMPANFPSWVGAGLLLMEKQYGGGKSGATRKVRASPEKWAAREVRQPLQKSDAVAILFPASGLASGIFPMHPGQIMVSFRQYQI